MSEIEHLFRYAGDFANIAEITAGIGWDPQVTDGITYSVDANKVAAEVLRMEMDLNLR